MEPCYGVPARMRILLRPADRGAVQRRLWCRRHPRPERTAADRVEVTLKTLNELMAKLNLPDRNPLTAALVKASYEVIDIKEEMQAAEADEDQEAEE